jgi:hypothetical protein
MRFIRKAIQCLALAVLLAAAAGAAYIYGLKPVVARPSSITIERTPERLARGKYLFILADCDGCHSGRDFSRFDGPVIPGRTGVGSVFPKEMGLPGRIAPPNITPDPTTGIGKWTDAEKVRAIREGISCDGRPLFPMMPYLNFRRMSDEDVYSLVAYLDTIPPVRNVVPRSKLDFPVSVLIRTVPQPVGHVPPPDTSTMAKKGEYLVTLAGCRDCHTPALSGGERFSFIPGVTTVSANITPDLTTGLGRWTAQHFVDRIAMYREYVEHGSPAATPQSFTVMPWLNFAQLPDNDLRAIFAYLRTVTPVTNAVETHPGFDPKMNGGATRATLSIR